MENDYQVDLSCLEINRKISKLLLLLFYSLVQQPVKIIPEVVWDH